MTFIQLVLLFLLVYLCVFSLISRICQCIEHCSSAKALSKLTERDNTIKDNKEGTDNHELSKDYANQYR